MSYLDSLLKHCLEKEVGTIDIHSAILWKWIDYEVDTTEPPSKDLFVFNIKSEKNRHFSGIRGSGYSTQGACFSSWKSSDKNSLLMDLREMVIEAAAQNFDSHHAIAQFAKIRQFAALGSESFYMAQALSLSIGGKGYDDLEFWKRFKD